MKLIDEWRKAWKFWSVQILTIGIVAQTVWAALPDESRSLFPGPQYIGIGLGLAALGARLFKQGSGDGD